MAQPKTWYTQAGDVSIAYQVLGDGPVDLLYVWGGFSNIEVMWEEPSCAAFFRRLAEFTRLILFDRRGCGVSDRGGAMVTPTLEERQQDALAVLDAVGSEQASIFGLSEGGVLAALLAATYPERVRSVILYGTLARYRRDAEHPWGWMDDQAGGEFVEAMARGWGFRSQWAVSLWAPTMAGDERFKDWIAKFSRQSLSRRDVLPFFWANLDYDLVDVFPAVRTPAIVLHRRDDRLVPVSHGRRIAEHIPDARFVELAGVDHFPFIGDSEEVLAAVEEFLIGSSGAERQQRKLLTLMFTNIAASPASGLADDALRELVASHDRVIRDHLARFDGREVKRLGDGFLAVFDGPARAVRCAIGIADAAERLGLSLRIGVHTGECEIVGDDVQGITVHVGARIAEQAAPGEILASSTVRDLVAGSGLRFGEGRPLELQGSAERRTVFPVLVHGATPEAVRRMAVERENLLRRDGEYWTIAYEGFVVTLRDSKGLRDIARLLAMQGREIHVLDLIVEADPSRPARASAASEAGLSVEQRGDDPLIDEAARADYRRRLTELQGEIDAAETTGDTVDVSAAREEYEALVEELSSAYGLGGRIRRTPDHIERARKTVTRRIRETMRRIEGVHPGLGKHLNASLQTGVFCSYKPERDVAWFVMPA